MRTPTAILGLAALFGAFLQAPYLHIHIDISDHPAASPAHVHAQLASKTSGPAIAAHTADEDAFDVEWTISLLSAAPFPLALAATETAVITPPPFASAALLMTRPRGHDPPDLVPKQPRAPPA